MKKFLISFLCGGFFLLGCSTYTTIRSPRYFNPDVEILDYHANPWETIWKVRASEGETMKLVFLVETIEIDFKEDPENAGEFIFTVRSGLSETTK